MKIPWSSDRPYLRYSRMVRRTFAMLIGLSLPSLMLTT